MSRPTVGVALAALVCMAGSGCQEAAPSEHPLDPTANASPEPRDTRSAATPSVRETTTPRKWWIRDPRISESSGLARSPGNPGVFYTHNDRGSAPHLYAVNPTGTLAVLRLDVAALDWEDVATTPDGRIWVGDIGDNDRERSSIEVAVIEEPDVLVSAAIPATTYTFAYPDGRHDAESLLVDPRDHRIHVVTKDEPSGAIYRAPEDLDPDGVNELEKVAPSPSSVSGGDFAADGRTVVLRKQGRAYFYGRLGGKGTEVPLPDQRQGESITFTADGARVLVGSEGTGSAVLSVPTPKIAE